MYEHLRNDYAMKLSMIFSPADVNLICGILDGVAVDYEVSEKSTALMVYEDRFPRLAEIYLQAKRLEGVSKNTEKLYRNRLRIFFDHVQMSPDEIKTNDIRCFLAGYQRQTGISDRTLDKDRQIINGFFAWCVDEEYLVKNPCKNIKEIKYEVKPRRALTRMQLETMRRACQNERETAIVDTLYSTGCRVSELANMRLSDINTEDKSVRIKGKGSKYNICYFNIDAQLSLDDYIKTREDQSDYLFVGKRTQTRLSPNSIERIVKQIAERVELNVTPHVIRHTTATLALQSGMQLTQVQKMLGHSSPDTTLIYAEVLQDDIKNAHLKFVV